MSTTKPFAIPKQLVMEAFKLVKANAGSGGIDKESIEDFEKNLKDNLYKIWNRMSSGTYFPQPVKAVSIPKKTGGERILGIPTISDRVAQTVAKLVLEPMIEPTFLPDSYGYRPGKSALDAVGVTRKRCWEYAWVYEFDVRGLFDNISHELLLKAVRKHCDCKWVLLYIERWLTAPMQLSDGTLVERTKGTPQGGVVSPCLSNLFMHYVFDYWMKRNFPMNPWCRYADDGLVHCRTQADAEAIRDALTERFASCGLEIHPTKSRIVYCKDGKRKGKYPITKFDFLGFTFRTRAAKNSKNQEIFATFCPAVSNSALKSMHEKIRHLNIRNRSDLSLADISHHCDPILRGWEQYYGKFYGFELNSFYQHFNKTLMEWAKRKYRKLKRRNGRAHQLILSAARKQPQLFIHWRKGIIGFV